MTKEIGGYFGAEQYVLPDGKEYYGYLTALNTARNALVYLVKAKKIRKLYIPYYLCDSVSLVCDREGFDYGYYHTDENFLPIFDAALAEDEYLYVVNLYGQLSNSVLAGLKQKYVRVIVDNIHAFYQSPLEGTDTIYSCRKFFGVPDGAYLASGTVLKEEIPVDISDERTSHIYGRIRDGASAHYAEFRANDDLFEHLPLMKMSGLTHRMLSEIDYEKVKSIREQNFTFLHSSLEKLNKLTLRLPEGPYAYPFYCANGGAVRKQLAQKNIYIAKLWPNVTGVPEQDYADNILPLPCDQRYGKEEMNVVLEELMKCLRI